MMFPPRAASASLDRHPATGQAHRARVSGPAGLALLRPVGARGGTRSSAPCTRSWWWTRPESVGSPKALSGRPPRPRFLSGLPGEGEDRVRRRPNQAPWAWGWRQPFPLAGDPGEGGAGARGGRQTRASGPGLGGARPSEGDSVNQPAPGATAPGGQPRPGRQGPAARAAGAACRAGVHSHDPPATPTARTVQDIERTAELRLCIASPSIRPCDMMDRNLLFPTERLEGWRCELRDRTPPPALC